MKNARLLIGVFVGVLLATGPAAYAINITVPSAPGAGYYLVSTSTGAYIYTPNPFTPTTIAGLTSTDFILRSTSTVGISTTSPNIINLGPDRAYLTNASSSDFVYLYPASSTRNLVLPSDTITTGLVIRQATSSPSAADPDTISDLEAWYQADSLALSDNDPVSTWTDSSGNGRNVTQAGAARPTYKTNILNGEPVVRFDGVDDYLSLAQSFISGNDWTIIAVSKSTSGTGVVASNDASGNRGWVFWRGTTGGNFETNGTGGTVYTTGSGYNIVTVRGGIEIYVDGGINASAVRSIPSNTATFEIGRRTFGEKLTGDVAELIIYSKKLSLLERAQVETYLSSKYGISVTETGNLFELQDSSGNVAGAFTGQGRFGLGETLPPAQLSVKQTSVSVPAVNIQAATGITSNLLDIKSGAGSNVFAIDNNFRVGINTGTPTEQVDISSGNLRIGNGYLRIVDANITKGAGVPFIFGSGIELDANLYGSNSANGSITINGTRNATKTSSQVLLNPTGGLVGIGTVAPSSTLHVLGTATTTSVKMGSATSIWCQEVGDAAGGTSWMYVSSSVLNVVSAKPSFCP